jgi:iron(III) transport system substrate-binding protein
MKRRRSVSLGCAILLGLGILAACARAPAVSSPAPSNPAQPSGDQAQAQRAAEWRQVVDAARREGKLSIYGPPGDAVQEALVQGFKERYPEITVEYTAGNNTQLAPKVLTEASAGLHLADIHIGGTDAPMLQLLPAGVLDPVPPYLVGPDSSDASKWRDGRFEFADTLGEYVLVPAVLTHPGLAYNPNLVDLSGVKSWRELLDPKYQGKMSWWDPRRSGAGFAMAGFLLYNEQLGKDVLEQLLSQNVTFYPADSNIQALQWVANGRAPINLAVSTNIATSFIERGLPIKLAHAATWKEGTWLTSGSSSISVLKHAPHPNALRVYLDWHLGREAQLAYSKAITYASLRRDVPTDHLNPAVVPEEGVQYFKDYKQEYQERRAREVPQTVEAVLRRLGQ